MRRTALVWVAGLLLVPAGLVQAEERRFVLGSGCRVPVIAADRQAVSGPTGRRTHLDKGTGLVFTSEMTAAGTALLTGRGGGLEFRKEVTHAGAFTLVLTAGGDSVTLRGDDTAVTITRGGRTIRIDAGGDEEASFGVRRLLAGSRAVRALRRLAMGLDASTQKKVSGVGMLLADALVGYLDGDIAAPWRYGQQVAAKARGRLRPVVLRQEEERESGCYERYEDEVCRAWDDYMQCLYDTEYRQPWRDICGMRWTLWVESAWFSFISCSAFGAIFGR